MCQFHGYPDNGKAKRPSKPFNRDNALTRKSTEHAACRSTTTHTSRSVTNTQRQRQIAQQIGAPVCLPTHQTVVLQVIIQAMPMTAKTWTKRAERANRKAVSHKPARCSGVAVTACTLKSPIEQRLSCDKQFRPNNIKSVMHWTIGVYRYITHTHWFLAHNTDRFFR